MSNLEHLENVVNFHYHRAKTGTDNDKANFYSAVNDIAKAILKGYYKIDDDDIAHDYATGLFERVCINGETFDKSGERVPFTKYISLNIRDSIFQNGNWNNPIDTIEDDVRSCIDNPTEIGDRLYKLLKLYYSDDEIKRKLPICVDLIYETTAQPISRTLPKDLRSFGITLVCLAKRLSKQEHTEINTSIDTVEQALKASFRSSIFLGLLAENSKNLPIFLSLDIDSLFRLASIAGGQRITVPSMQYINNLINTTVVATNLIKENKDVDTIDYKYLSSLNSEFKIRTDQNKQVSLTSLQKLVKSALDVYNNSIDDEPSDSLLGSLSVSLTAINKLVDDIDIDVSAKTLSTFVDRHQDILDKLKKKLDMV
jgi:hypothetical protein